MQKNEILISGATGFIGCSLVFKLLSNNVKVKAIVRQSSTSLPLAVEQFAVGDLAELALDDFSVFWGEAFNGVDVVVHTAARVHMLVDTASDPLAEFRRINVQGTLNLAQQAAAAGVRRFVFVSSIGVNGAETFQKPFTDQDQAAPHSPYAVSKYEAELCLQVLAAETGMEVVIIRPPLVYGPGAPGNFDLLMRWLRRGVPLPLGAIHNKRSLVSLDNLVDLLVTCLTHPAAANQTFMVSDGEDVSTTELLQRMGQAMSKPARLLPVPASWLKVASALVGKGDVAQRLCGSLQVDISKTRELLGWVPPVSLDEGLRRAAGGHGFPAFARNDGRLE